MNQLAHHDLQFILHSTPANLLAEMKSHPEQITIAGGFVRAVISRESVNDIDVFVDCEETANRLAKVLGKSDSKNIHRTENAFTIKNYNPVIQIIHRWKFESPEDVVASFDFTICAAAFFYDGDTWASVCDDRFYSDLASRRLTYRRPIREENAGGSALRLLKYYQRGYRTPIDSYAAILARIASKVDWEDIKRKSKDIFFDREVEIARLFTGLLREVDPDIDPKRIAHLPAEDIRDSGGLVENRISESERNEIVDMIRTPVTNDIFHD